MKSFARTTKLPSISGRAGYMSDPGKQEEIVLESEPVDWQPYIDYEATQHKTNARQNEGREMMVSLSNDWYDLPKDELRNRVDQIAKAVVGEGRDYQWAVHWNKDRTNLHVHIIFSERLRVKEPAVWDRDVYLRDDGKVARKKSERAREPDGTFKPPIHKKGELKSDPFTAKDASFKSKEWLHMKKQELRQLMADQWGVKFERQPHLPEFHEGKGAESETIKKKNIVIRENNRRLDFLESQGVDVSDLVKKLKAIRKEAKDNPEMKDRTALLWKDSKGQIKVTGFHNPDRAIFQIDQTAGAFQEQKAPELRPDPEPQQPKEPEIVVPEVPARPDPEQKQPEMDAGNAINAENSPLPEINDKKEVEKEPPAPVEKVSFIERIRNTLSSFIARKAQQAAWEPPAERERVYVPEPKLASEKLKKALSDFKAADQKDTEARMNFTAANKLPFWDKTKDAKKDYYLKQIREADRERSAAFDVIKNSGILLREVGGTNSITAGTCSGENLAAITDRVAVKVKELQQAEAPRKPSLQTTMAKAQESIAVQKYREQQKKIAPAVEARLAEKAKNQSKSKGMDR